MMVKVKRSILILLLIVSGLVIISDYATSLAQTGGGEWSD